MRSCESREKQCLEKGALRLGCPLFGWLSTRRLVVFVQSWRQDFMSLGEKTMPGERRAALELHIVRSCEPRSSHISKKLVVVVFDVIHVGHGEIFHLIL